MYHAKQISSLALHGGQLSKGHDVSNNSLMPDMRRTQLAKLSAIQNVCTSGTVHHVIYRCWQQHGIRSVHLYMQLLGLYSLASFDAAAASAAHIPATRLPIRWSLPHRHSSWNREGLHCGHEWRGCCRAHQRVQTVRAWMLLTYSINAPLPYHAQKIIRHRAVAVR